MQRNGLVITYSDGINTVFDGEATNRFAVGELLCRIYQDEHLYNIATIVRNCINECPMNNDIIQPDTGQDQIEDAECYILQALEYDDFAPAVHLAQGSFIRCMEYYRALDFHTKLNVWTREIERAKQYKDLFSDIGFGKIGEFLRLCFNNYIIDLDNGITLFHGMAAVKAGNASKEEKMIYEQICGELNTLHTVPGIEMNTLYNTNTGTFQYVYIINSFMAMALFEFSHLEESEVKILRCQNPECRKFFTSKNKNAKYCSFPSPQNSARTCKEYYPSYLYRKRVKKNEVQKIKVNALGRLYNDRRRHPEHKDEITELIGKINNSFPGWEHDVAENKKTITEYQAWTNSIRREKEI